MATKKETTKGTEKKAEKKKVSKNAVFYVALGRRKSAVARIKLEAGDGKIIVNDMPMEKYFPVPSYQSTIKQPLTATNLQEQFDVTMKTRGGGKRAQSDAGRLAIARAILLLDKEHRAVLKAAGYLKRDAREKERKKYGLKGARRAPQFSKR